MDGQVMNAPSSKARVDAPLAIRAIRAIHGYNWEGNVPSSRMSNAEPSPSTPAVSSATPAAAAPASGRRNLRRRWLAALLLLGGLAVGFLGYFYYRAWAADRQLEEAIAEADRLDPGWRLADLEAARVPVPWEKNSAPLIQRIGTASITALNKGEVSKNLLAITKELEGLRPTVRLDGRQTETLRGRLAPLAELIAEARKLAELPQGRHPLNVSPPVMESAPHVDHASILIWLLAQDALLRAQDGDVTGAWVSCQAIHNIARSFGDEPLWLAQGVRVARRREALRLMQRVLAQGQVSEEALALAQRLLDEETAHAPLLIVLRAQRARVHHLFTQLAGGQASLAEVQQVAAGNFGSPTWEQQIRGFFDRGGIKPAHAWLLRHYNEAVESAKQPGALAEEGLKKLPVGAGGEPPLANAARTSDWYLTQFAPRRIEADLACGRAALAIERYRLRHRRWPATLAQVIAEGLLDEVPRDPYVGGPLGYVATPDGVMVFSVGPQGDRDALQRDPTDPEHSHFRLWNPERRRGAK
jgi:hypothetical protein